MNKIKKPQMRNFSLSDKKAFYIHHISGAIADIATAFVAFLCITPIFIFFDGLEFTPVMLLGIAAVIGSTMFIIHGYKKLKTIRFWQASGTILAWYIVSLILHAFKY